MATLTLNTALIAKLAAEFNFDSGAFILAAVEGGRMTSRSARTDRSDFLTDLESAEAKDDAKARAKADKSATAKMSKAEKEAAALAKKEAKAAAAAAKEAKPKRAQTGYQLFCADLRPQVTTALLERLAEEAPGEKLAPTSTMKELAAQWKDLTEDEKGEWKTKAAALKEAKSGSSSDGAASSDETQELESDLADETPTPAPTAPLPSARKPGRPKGKALSVTLPES